MTKKILLPVVALLLAAAYFGRAPMVRLLAAGDAPAGKGFVEFPLPLAATDRFYDLGVVDANGDGFLDLYTSNHHFRQALLIADGKGGYRDTLSEWGLDQSAFQMAELSFVAPKAGKPGVYVYWLGTDFVIRAHRTRELGNWRGSLHVFDPVEVVRAGPFRVDKKEATSGKVTETTLGFSAAEDGMLVLRPGGQGLPLEFAFDGDIEPANIFVGRLAVPPRSARFSLAMQDRHALAWADFNGDGVLDVFINRGALAGTLRAYPEPVVRGVRDELLLSVAPGRFEERGAQVGLEKKGCSSRHARWVDFDGDGLLDLFVNCYDRDNVEGDYPKQLYRQGPAGKLRDVAQEVGIGLPEQQMANLAWVDVDNDGRPDLLAFQDQGLFLYRNRKDGFVQEPVLKRGAESAPKIGQGRGNAWFYDGKLTVADYDGDGYLDFFSSSKRGNALLRNAGGRLEIVDLGAAGLPATSDTANWVDYDNDGLADLHLVPQGLFRQRADHTFERTGLLEVHPDRYDAVVVNWGDLDNDGRLDVIFALDENREFRRWWESDREPARRGRWQLLALRNTAAAGHWLQVELDGDAGNRQGIGTVVEVKAGDSKRAQVVGASEGSFFSQGHYRLYFGLGPRTKVDSIRVRWPDGAGQEIGEVAIDGLVRIKRGQGAPTPAGK